MWGFSAADWLFIAGVMVVIVVCVVASELKER
jgi:hypothetical protein